MRRQGYKINDMFFQDFGIRLINFVLVARTDRLEKQPDLYKRFVGASLKGWAELRSKPDDAVAALKEQYPEIKLDRDTLLAQLTQGIVPFVCTPELAGCRQGQRSGLAGDLRHHDQIHEPEEQ